jgi:hypothetical protein
MRLERIHRWQWVIIGLIIGFLVGYVRNIFSGDDLHGYGNSMNGQEQFEAAILTRERISETESRPLFYQLVVFDIRDPNPPVRSLEDIQKTLNPEQKKQFDAIKKESDKNAFLREIARDEAAQRRTYAVAGAYYNRRPIQNAKTGVWEKNWRPYFYVTSNPYTPSKNYAVSGTVPPVKRTFLDRIRTLTEKIRLKDPDPPNSVLGYLNALKAQGRIDYTYQWWKAPRITIVLWMVGCAVFIGGIWPTVINLLVYRTFSRPYEEKVDLSKVRNKAASKQRGPSEADLAELAALEADLEARLRAGATDAPPAPADQPVPAAVKPLTAKELEVAAAKAEEARLFAAKADDFYPVEKRTHKRDE